MSLLADIRTLLTGINSNVYLGDIPDTPDNCLSIFNTGGQPTEYKLDGVSYEKPTFQIRARNTSYATAEDELNQVKDALNDVSEQTINSTTYMAFYITSDIFTLGKDDRERTNLTINFVAFIKE